MVDRFGQSIDSSKQAKEDREYLEKVKREVS
jgi:hypothetical protein